MPPFSRLRGNKGPAPAKAGVPEEPAPAKAGGGWGELWHRLLLALWSLMSSNCNSKIKINSFHSPAGSEPPFFACAKKPGAKKHALPPRPRRYAARVHSAGRIFRRDIPVSSKNDAHPCASPHAGSCLPAPSLRKGPGKSTAGARARAEARAKAKAKAKAALSPTPLP